MNVAKITEETAQAIAGQIYQGNNRYNPVLDGIGNHIVSLTEAQYLPLNDFQVIEFVAPEIIADEEYLQ